MKNCHVEDSDRIVELMESSVEVLDKAVQHLDGAFRDLDGQFWMLEMRDPTSTSLPDCSTGHCCSSISQN